MGFKAVLSSVFSKKKCSVDPGIDAILAVIRLCAKASRGTALTAASGGNPLALVLSYGVLLPDLFKILAEYDDIPCELASLTHEKYDRLLNTVTLEFGLAGTNAHAVINASLELIKELTGFAPKFQALVKAVHDYKN